MLKTRLLTVALILPVFLAALFFLPGRWWAAALLPLLLIGSWEWGTLAGYGQRGRGLFTALVLASAAALFYLQASAADDFGRIDLYIYGAAAVFWVALAPVWLVRQWRIRNPLLLGATGWIVLVPMWMALVELQSDPWLLLAVLGAVWIADTAAYLAGKRWGRRKLAPAISPGKTWEGVFGSVAAVAVYYVILSFVITPEQRVLAGFAGAVMLSAIIALSITGDLFESWMKRQAGVKDSGNLLPGHGGVLDRVDGWTASMPVVALAVLYLR
jgi:phosphatidate cytidylyltransferase